MLPNLLSNKSDNFTGKMLHLLTIVTLISNIGGNAMSVTI